MGAIPGDIDDYPAEEQSVCEKIAVVCERLFLYIEYFEKHPRVGDVDDEHRSDVESAPWGTVLRNEAKEFFSVFREYGGLFDDYTGILELNGIKDKDTLIKAIPSSNIETLLAMLTALYRKDRWSGSLERAIRDGTVLDILKRLRELHESRK